MKWNKYHGFTLIETLIAATLGIAVLFAVYKIQHIISTNQILFTSSYLSIDDANRNVSDMIRTIRNARASDNGSYPIELADDQEIIIYSDIDFDDQSERVRYYVDNDSLMRGVIEPAAYPATYPSSNEKVKILIENLKNDTQAVFTYYNGEWPEDIVNNPLSNPINISSVRLVFVHLILNQDDNLTTDYQLQSYTQIRMLKDNL